MTQEAFVAAFLLNNQEGLIVKVVLRSTNAKPAMLGEAASLNGGVLADPFAAIDLGASMLDDLPGGNYHAGYIGENEVTPFTLNLPGDQLDSSRFENFFASASSALLEGHMAEEFGVFFGDFDNHGNDGLSGEPLYLGLVAVSPVSAPETDSLALVGIGLSWLFARRYCRRSGSALEPLSCGASRQSHAGQTMPQRRRRNHSSASTCTNSSRKASRNGEVPFD